MILVNFNLFLLLCLTVIVTMVNVNEVMVGKTLLMLVMNVILTVLIV